MLNPDVNRIKLLRTRNLATISVSLTATVQLCNGHYGYRKLEKGSIQAQKMDSHTDKLAVRYVLNCLIAMKLGLLYESENLSEVS